MKDNIRLPELLIETSWEVCNKIGGIYTVLSTKAKVLKEKFGENLVFIGPDINPENNHLFENDDNILKNFANSKTLPFGIKVRGGRWKIPGSPQVLLITFENVFEELNTIFARMWQKFGVDSLKEYGDYREGCAFSIAAAIIVKSLINHMGINPLNAVAHFNEWTTGMGLLYLEDIQPEVATVFTTHATSIGRSICGNGKPLYDYFDGYNGDQMAQELNMEAKHSLEKVSAHRADCFTAVSEITGKECEKLLEKLPDVITPNGFEADFVPGQKRYQTLKEKGRDKIIKIVSLLKKKILKDPVIIATSGRNEYRNKGLDIYLDSIKELERLKPDKDIIALILVPAWVKDISYPLKELLINSNIDMELKDFPDYLTHRLYNEDSDLTACRIREMQLSGEIDNKVNIIYVPCYLSGDDGILEISYYDFLPAIDITVFPSYYEPWGYTPLESIAFGVPTITSDKSGFGQWILSNFKNSIEECGVKVIERTDSNYDDFTSNCGKIINDFINKDNKEQVKIKKMASETASQAAWKYFIKQYEKAFSIALEKRDARIK